MELYRRVCEKKLSLRGQEVAYRVTAEDFPLTNAQGVLEATLFSYSYVRQPEDPDRPVLFIYNGGPGADSAYLHLGIMGPRRLALSDEGDPLDPGLRDNEACLLDRCDLVMIDPVGAGYACLLDPQAAERYYETGGDAASFVRLMESWIDRHSRWRSPVYLVGESYGTIRNVAIADQLSQAVRLKGIVSIGTSINHGMPELQVEPNVRKFASYAAAAWFHYPEGKPALEEHLRQAEDFAYTDYAKALLWGSLLPEEERRTILERLSWFTGMSREYLLQNRLRIDLGSYLSSLCPGRTVGYYDARYSKEASGPVPMDQNGAPLISDAFVEKTSPLYANSLRRYLREELELDPGRPYQNNMEAIGRAWSYDRFGKDVMKLLEQELALRKDLRIMFVNGAYDMLSTAGFVRYYMAQYDIPPERSMVRVYESGHMTYVGKSFQALGADLRRFILDE